MCGIAGQIYCEAGYVKDRMPIYEKMQRALRRRGPDQRGIYTDQYAALIHTRLCVIDPQGGKQPMRYERGDEEYVLVYNGELYNTEQIRRELTLRGYCFEGHSDTEVLLQSYVEWKDKCVEKFNGIFAFAVWEKHNGRLFIARDRIGVKPFFYTLRGRSFLFASELKALLCDPDTDRHVSREGLAELLLIGPGRTPGGGVFNGIKELRAGECGYYDIHADKLNIRRYWRLRDREHTQTFEQTAETTRELVLDAIRRQLVSDVPVCTFLSGGLDSSIISSVADRYFTSRGVQLHTVSVDYKDNAKYFRAGKFQPNSDAAYIEKMNEYLNAQNHLCVLDTPELVDALYEAVCARDLPGMADVDASLLLFCRQVKQIGTVALSGECADEIFGGYPWYRDKSIRDRDGFPWAQSTAYRVGFIQPQMLQGIDPFEYVNERYLQTLADTDVLPGTSAEETRMRQMTALNLHWFMQTLLDRKDRMSMYNGLEVRVPFCDYRIAEYLYSVPWEFKDYHGVEKGLLRAAMRGLLPDEVLWRKKSPYPKTHNPKYLQAVRGALQNVLSDPSAPILSLLRKEKLQELLTQEVATPWYGQLMTTPQTIAYFLQLNYWLKEYRVLL